MKPFTATLTRDVLIALRSRTEMLNPIAFFLLVTVMFALVFGRDLGTRHLVGIPAIWTTALFANMLALEGLFRREHDDGTLALMLIDNSVTLPSTVAKLIAHWLLTGMPICILAPVLGVAFGMSQSTLLMLAGTLVVGSMVFTLVGSVCGALIVGLQRGGVLLTLLVFPLYIPVMLLGIGTCQLHQAGEEYTSHLVGSLAILAGCITAIPLAIGPVLRASQDQ